MSFVGSVLSVLLWERYGNRNPYVFSTGYFQSTLLLFLCRNSSSDDKHLLPEATLGIDEKATEEISDQNFSNAKFLTTDAAHTPITLPFLLLFGVVGRFLTYFISNFTSSVGTN